MVLPPEIRELIVSFTRPRDYWYEFQIMVDEYVKHEGWKIAGLPSFLKCYEIVRKRIRRAKRRAELKAEYKGQNL